jgi:segregation and condensation protein A
VAELFAARLVEQAAYLPRRVGAEDVLKGIAPDLLAGVEPEELVRMAAAALTPTPPPEVTTTHIAPPKLSVAEAVADLAERLRQRGSSSFEDLVGKQAVPIEVVVGLLALLELYKRSLVEIEQTATFGDIAVRWTGGEAVEPAAILVEEPT